MALYHGRGPFGLEMSTPLSSADEKMSHLPSLKLPVLDRIEDSQY